MPLEPPFSDPGGGYVCLRGYNFYYYDSPPDQMPPGVSWGAVKNCSTIFIVQNPDCVSTLPCACVANYAGEDYEAELLAGSGWNPQCYGQIVGLATADFPWPPG